MYICIHTNTYRHTHPREAMKIFLESGYFNNLRRLNSDEGKEFYNQHVKRVLDKRGIIHYSVSSREIKASLTERLIRTIKGKLYKYMSHNNTRRYIDVLPDIIESYNNSYHRGLGLHQTPNHVHNLTKCSDIKAQFNLMYKKKHTSNKAYHFPFNNRADSTYCG